jgi:hypothetical protein
MSDPAVVQLLNLCLADLNLAGGHLIVRGGKNTRNRAVYLTPRRGQQQGGKGERHGHEPYGDQFRRRHALDDVLGGDERVAPDEGDEDEQARPEGCPAR